MHARIVAVSALALCARAANTVVDLGYASYRGVQSAEFPLSVAFLGVPYAEPPVGDLRFRGTVPLNTTRVAEEAGGEAVDVTQYPNFCIQGSIGFGDAGGAGSEDCLKVNIYAPANATADSSFPVLVYIHGGGYSSGNPRNWPFDHWIQQSPNIVVVSVYYRLKSLGFLSHPSFAPEDLNGGIRDQLQALRWVNEHITAFGGDPSRVTINGESAGGGSVEIHLVAKEGQQLFHGAIPQSVAHGAVPDPERTVELFEAFVAQVGCPNGTVPEQVACLRKASVSAIARAQDAVSGGFSPVVDGSLITDHPTVSINNGDFLHVPLLVGATSNESFTDGSNFAAPLRSSFPTVTNETLKRWEAAYPVSQFGGDATLRNIAAAGEVLLRCPREIMSTAWREDELPAFSYRFNQPNPSFGPSNLTQHAAENWWMFMGSNTGTNGSATFTEMTPAQTAFAQELIAYWISFVRTADPSTERLARSPAWPLFDPTGERSRMVLQMNQVNSTMETANVIEEENTEELGRCAFVASIAEELEN